MKAFVKISLIIMASLAYCNVTIAQDLDTPNSEEISNQKQTQTKYHIKHIVLLQTYLGYLKQGYQIVQKGLKVVADIKDGTFTLDKGYIGELKNVKPVIARSAKVAESLRLQRLIVADVNRLVSSSRKSGMFTPSEIRYLETVKGNVLKNCEASVDELTDVITSERIVMRDDERLARIDKICDDSQAGYAFVKVFSAQAVSLARERQHDGVDIGQSLSLNGIRS